MWSSLEHKLGPTLYLLTLFFIPSQLGKHFWPNFSFVQGIKIDFLSPTLYLTDIFIVLLFLSTAHILARSVLNKTALLLLLIFSAPTILAIFMTKEGDFYLYSLLRFIEYAYFAWYTYYYVKKNGMTKNILRAFVFGILFEGALAIHQFVTQESIGGVFYFFGERFFTGSTPGIANASLGGHLVLRPYGTFPHPNVLAGHLLLAMIYLLLYLHVDILWKRFLVILTYSIGQLGLFISLSRTAILLWFVSLPVIILYHTERRINLKKILISFAAILVIVFVSILSPLRERFMGLSVSDESFVIRQKLAQSSIAMFRDHPLFGVGLQHFIPSIPHYFHGVTFSMLQPVHNIFLLLAAEQGLYGLLLAGILFYNAILLLKRRLKERKNKKILVFAFPLCVALLLGLVDHYLLTLHQGRLLFSFVLGQFFGIYNRKRII